MCSIVCVCVPPMKAAPLVSLKPLPHPVPTLSQQLSVTYCPPSLRLLLPHSLTSAPVPSPASPFPLSTFSLISRCPFPGSAHWAQTNVLGIVVHHQCHDIVFFFGDFFYPCAAPCVIPTAWEALEDCRVKIHFNYSFPTLALLFSDPLCTTDPTV